MLYREQLDTRKGRVGYLVREECVEQQGKGGLGLQSMVFQAELTAITRAARV